MLFQRRYSAPSQRQDEKLSVQCAVEYQCDGDWFDDDFNQKIDRVVKFIGQLTEILHERGVLSDNDLLKMIDRAIVVDDWTI